MAGRRDDGDGDGKGGVQADGFIPNGMDTLVGTRDQKWISRCDLASLVRDYSKIMQARPTAALAARPDALSAPYESSRAFPTSNKLSQSLARILRDVWPGRPREHAQRGDLDQVIPIGDASGGPSRIVFTASFPFGSRDQ